MRLTWQRGSFLGGMLTAAELKPLLQAHQLRLTKKLGQNYLINKPAISRIVSACALNKSEAVVEIGAGLGALTESLAQEAKQVTAVEIDRGIFPLLAVQAQQWPGVIVKCQDIFTLPDEWLKEAVVVGAIPYHITSPILVWLSERRQMVRRAVFIVQKEVAERLVALPGKKSYGRLSLLAQYGWETTLLFTVPRSAFFPQPVVDSACVRFMPRPKALLAPDREGVFFALVKAAFSQRRKQLVNNLQTIEGIGPVSRKRIEQLLRQSGHLLTARGEELSLDQFLALTNAFCES